jgi:hypothetical protein
MKRLWITFLLLQISFYSFSQNKNSRFESVDAKISSLPAYKSDDLDSLSVLLTKDFSAEAEKVRAVYFWVANNISYNTPKFIERTKKANELSKRRDESESAEEIIHSRKAVCEGYSNLVKKLCNKSGIKCEVVEGIGRPDNFRGDLHAWNAVKINGEWKLLDATWSAGGIDVKDKTYHKNFSDEFFLMSPSEFIKTHYPFDPVWQLLSPPVKRKEFEASKSFSSDSTVFNFNDSINIYLQQDSIAKMISSSRRAFEFDPSNELAKRNFHISINYNENEKMNVATKIFQEGVNRYNECTKIINDAKKIKSTKMMDENERKLHQLLKDSRESIEKAVSIYQAVKFTDSTNWQILKLNIQNGINNLKELDGLEKYLKRYFSISQVKRSSVL